MNFMLPFNIEQAPVPIHISESILLMGSCFAEEIGLRLQQHKFKALINPNGIQFNPVSIFRALRSYVNVKMFGESDLFESRGLWYSWEHHGAFADPDPSAALKKMNESLLQAKGFIEKSSHVMLTFGSAFVYELKESGEVIANCHQVPQAAFNKRMLSVKEIISGFENLLELPDYRNKRFILTISPVRYVRDGLVENNHSKSILIRAVHELVLQHPQVYYFPAYEIVMDELRDYRFFKKDLVHPNELAIDYVWQRFAEAVFDSSTKKLLPQIESIVAAARHKPLHAHSSAHEEFRKATLTKINELIRQLPGTDFTAEAGIFNEA